MTLLSAQNVSKRYNGLKAVNDVTFSVEKGEIRGVIGPNGAGKTTMVSILCGRVLPTSGTLTFRGENVTNMAPWDRVNRGIVYTFQITSVFRKLTCRENLELAVQRQTLRSRFSLFSPSKAKLEEMVERQLASVGLLDQADRLAGELPYGSQRLLEISMGMALKPALLILDEPTQGLAVSDIGPFCDLIRETAKSTTILFIEHNLPVVLELAHRVTVMDQGAILAEGTPSEIEQHPLVQRAYLGD